MSSISRILVFVLFSCLGAAAAITMGALLGLIDNPLRSGYGTIIPIVAFVCLIITAPFCGAITVIRLNWIRSGNLLATLQGMSFLLVAYVLLAVMRDANYLGFSVPLVPLVIITGIASSFIAFAALVGVLKIIVIWSNKRA